MTSSQEQLQNIIHDLRSPLTSIIGYAAALSDGLYESDEERQTYCRIIRDKAEYMTQLISHLSETILSGSDETVMHKSEFDISELVSRIFAEYQDYFETHGYQTKCSIMPNIIINGDKDAISRMLHNIIDNLIKHSGSGKYAEIALCNDDNILTIRVSDHGSPISDKDKQNIFSRFYKNPNSDGMGLGLSLTKELAVKHNGTIRVETLPDGAGNCFVLEFDLSTE